MTDRAEQTAGQDRDAQDHGGHHRVPTGSGPDQEALREALNGYLEARRTQRRGRPGSADAELAAARAALVHLLEQAGWEPPVSVRASLDADAALLRAQDRRSA